MQIEDILKYSQQIIAYTSETDYYMGNGFFVRYNGYLYFLTANHAIAPDLKQLYKIYLILHVNAIGLETRAIKIERWQYIDLYKFPDNTGHYTFPCFNERIDFAFCGINKEDFEKSVIKLNHRVKDADDASCHHKSFDCINLPQHNSTPNADGEYFLAGKILYSKDAITWEYKSYFYSGMKYIGQDAGDKLYEFQINQSSTIKDWAGLSGSPIFDKEMNFIGMALRYREEDNVLRVLPTIEIIDYLQNH